MPVEQPRDNKAEHKYKQRDHNTEKVAPESGQGIRLKYHQNSHDSLLSLESGSFPDLRRL
jgi:hypothetical protein